MGCPLAFTWSISRDFLQSPFLKHSCWTQEGKGKFLNCLSKDLGYCLFVFFFLFYYAYSVVTTTSENPLLNKCYQVLVSHIFSSHIEWKSASDKECCVRAEDCQAWPDSGKHIMDKEPLIKHEMPRDFLNNPVTINCSCTGLLSDISVSLIVATFLYLS